MARVPNTLSQTMSRNSANILGLVQSSLDLPTQDVYNFALWFNTEHFESDKTRKGTQVVSTSPALELFHPVAFHDYTTNNQCMGYGLRAVGAIGNQDTVIKMKTNLGLLSNSLVDSQSKDHYEGLKQEGKSDGEVLATEQLDSEIAEALTANTRKVAKLLAPGDLGIENRMYNHLLLAQKLIVAQKQDAREHKPSAMLIRNWINALPSSDLTNMLYWEKPQLVEVDSPNLIAQYKQAVAFNQRVYKMLIDDPESPYKKYSSQLQPDETKLPIDFDQWCWAFTIVSTRNLVLNNMPYQDTTDPNAIFMMVPLLDYLNHSQTPNCVVTGYHDKVQDNSFVVLQTIRDVAPGEQLCISYGNLPNSHLVQKYGFTLRDNPEKKVITHFPFRGLESLAYEELSLKQERAGQLGLLYMPTLLANCELFPNKFQQDILRTLRLSFTTSQMLLDRNGKDFMLGYDFKKPFDSENEQVSFKFLIECLEEMLSKFKPADHYLHR